MSDIFELSDSAVDRVAEADPVLATYHGIGGWDHAWPDLSPDGHGTRADFYRDLRSEAQAAPAGDDDRDHELAKDVLIEFCDTMLILDESGYHFKDLNNIASPHQELRAVFGSQAKNTVGDWQAVIERLATIDEPMAGYRASLDNGKDAGHVAARRQVEAVIEQGATTAGDQSSFHQLRSELQTAMAAGLSDEAGADGLLPKLDAAIEHAKRTFGRFNRYLTDAYLPAAAADDAVGEDRYRVAVRAFLGTDLDLAATYRWGWDEVERLWAEMKIACAAIDPDVPVAGVVDRLNTSPEFAASGIEEFIDLMTDRQHQALANLDGVHFDVPAQIRDIDVKVEPAGGALAPHYVGPSEDFTRPGTVWYPIEGRDHFPLFMEVTTAYHEGFPGHHLQVGLQATLADELSRFHRMMVWYPGSGEGWALYAEHVMGQLGYLERPEYVVGLLGSQLLRACRIAIDIGVHLNLPIPEDVTFHPGESWTYELAFELLVERSFSPVDMAHSEIVRYLGWPGQAISYKVGEQAIHDLRAEQEQRGNFEAKRFHSEVLAVGSTGLDLLRRRLTKPTGIAE